MPAKILIVDDEKGMREFLAIMLKKEGHEPVTAENGAKALKLIGEVLALGLANVKSVFVHHFMDRLTFDLARVVKCCNHYLARDGRLLPACVRNNIPA